MAGEQQVVFTRAARIKAGIPPPTPFFRRNSLAPSSSEQGETELKALSSDSSCEDSSTTSCSSANENDGSIGNTITTRQSLQYKKKRRRGKRRRRREKVTWVQCDNRLCRKWRTLPPDTEVDLTRDWFCHMHPDTGQSSCSVPEEKWEVTGKRKRYTFSLLEAGQLVWAKMTGFCPWPAVVSPDPWNEGEEGTAHVCEEREGTIYHVEFLGKDHTHNWIVEDKLEPYYGSEVKPHLGALRSSKSLATALTEADQLASLTPAVRLEKCVFRKNCTISNHSTDTGGKIKKLRKKKKEPLRKKKSSTPHSIRVPSTAPLKRASMAATTAVVQSTSRMVPQTLLASSTCSSQCNSSGRVLAQILGSSITTVSNSDARMVPVAGNGQTNSGIRMVPHTPVAGNGIMVPHTPVAGSGQCNSESLQLLFKTLSIPFSIDTARESKRATKSAGQPPMNLSTVNNPLAPAIINQLVQSVSRKAKPRKLPQKRKPRGNKTGTTGKMEVRQKSLPPSSSTHNISTTETTTLHEEPQTAQDTQKPEVCQLAEEAEGELREMENMLSLLPPSPPTSAPPTTAPTNTKDGSVDGSIESVLSEMAEIEGLLQNLDNAQIVPYTD